jgi:ABC-type transport system involved in cytochrome c biogenesis permease subunit
MSGISRFAGYLGLVFLLGGIISLILIPSTRFQSDATRATRDLLTGAAAIGYLLVLARMGYLSASDDRHARWALLVLVLLIVGVFAFLGIALILTTAPARPL